MGEEWLRASAIPEMMASMTFVHVLVIQVPAGQIKRSNLYQLQNKDSRNTTQPTIDATEVNSQL